MNNWSRIKHLRSAQPFTTWYASSCPYMSSPYSPPLHRQRHPRGLPWAYASVPYSPAQHVHQLSYFSNIHFVYPQHACKELKHTLSMCVRNWWVYWAFPSKTNLYTERSPFKTCWACMSGTYVYPEHPDQELMHLLSASRSDAYPERTHQFFYAYAQHMRNKNSKFEWVPSNHAKHTRKEPMLALSMCVRNWCIRVRNYTVTSSSKNENNKFIF